MKLTADLQGRMIEDAIERHGLRGRIPDPEVSWYYWPATKPAPRVEVEAPDFATATKGRDVAWRMICPGHGHDRPVMRSLRRPIPITRTPIITMFRSDWAEPFSGGSGHDLYAVFVGQCSECSTIYWSVVQVGQLTRIQA